MNDKQIHCPLPTFFHLPGPSPLAASLAKAQSTIKMVSADAVNSQFGYRYASAETLIAAAKDALAGHGLSLVPISQQLSVGSHPQLGPFISCTWVLLHSEGEGIIMVRDEPVCPDKRKTPDKAVSAASTLALAYLCRDLLLLPRDDGSEEAPPDPVPVKPAQQQQQQQQQKKKEEQPTTASNGRTIPKTGAELKQRLIACEAGLVKDGLCQAGDLLNYVGNMLDNQQLDTDLDKLDPCHISVISDLVRAWIKSRSEDKKAKEKA